MKKILYVILLAAGLTAATSAQNFSVGVDSMPLLKGIIWSDSDQKNSLFALSPSFEYLLAPNFSVGAMMDLWFGEASDTNIFYFGLAAQGRWYPLSEGLEKLFVGYCWALICSRWTVKRTRIKAVCPDLLPG